MTAPRRRLLRRTKLPWSTKLSASPSPDGAKMLKTTRIGHIWTGGKQTGGNDICVATGIAVRCRRDARCRQCTGKRLSRTFWSSFNNERMSHLCDKMTRPDSWSGFETLKSLCIWAWDTWQWHLMRQHDDDSELLDRQPLLTWANEAVQGSEVDTWYLDNFFFLGVVLAWQILCLFKCFRLISRVPKASQFLNSPTTYLEETNQNLLNFKPQMQHQWCWECLF